MAFSPLPRDYDEAIKEINVWRAKYTREARDEIEAQRRQVAEAKSIALDAESEARIATERADKERDRSDEAMAENAALRDDAERYRFIRQVNAFAIVEYCGMFGPKELKGKKLDKAIDAAREKTRKK
jgi:hypothetical protein